MEAARSLSLRELSWLGQPTDIARPNMRPGSSRSAKVAPNGEDESLEVVVDATIAELERSAGVCGAQTTNSVGSPPKDGGSRSTLSMKGEGGGVEEDQNGTDSDTTDNMQSQSSTAGQVLQQVLQVLQQVTLRLTQLLLGAIAVSLLPVIVPFGDPYDVSVEGYLKNTGYFVWYSGTGWGTIWLAQLWWARALLGESSGEGMRKALPRVVAPPTLFAILIFFLVYIPVGGPFPMGTLILGAPCFVVSWSCLWVWGVKSSTRGGREIEQSSDSVQASPEPRAPLDVKSSTATSLSAGPDPRLRVIVLFPLFVMQLIVYAVVTILIMRFPNQRDVFAVVFVLAESLVDDIDIEEWVYGEDVRSVSVFHAPHMKKKDDDASEATISRAQGGNLLFHSRCWWGRLRAVCVPFVCQCQNPIFHRMTHVICLNHCLR